MKNILKNQRGETIVEVLVSFMLLLMFTAMFVVSLRYARAMSQKAETLRETAYAFCADLYPQTDKPAKWEDDGGAQTYSFSRFTIDGVQLQQVDTDADVTEKNADGETETNTQHHTFHRYYKATGGT